MTSLQNSGARLGHVVTSRDIRYLAAAPHESPSAPISVLNITTGSFHDFRDRRLERSVAVNGRMSLEFPIRRIGPSLW